MAGEKTHLVLSGELAERGLDLCLAKLFGRGQARVDEESHLVVGHRLVAGHAAEQLGKLFIPLTAAHHRSRGR
jgi:hypothetical protein